MKRVRIGLRLMMLLVALCAVTFAWLGALRNIRDIETQGELTRLEFMRKQMHRIMVDQTQHPSFRQNIVQRMAEIDGEIAKRQKRLGKTVN